MMIRLAFAALTTAAFAAAATPSLAQQKQNLAAPTATCAPSPGISQNFPIPTIIEFDTGSTKIKPADQQKIAKLAAEAKAKYIQQICVTGSADKQGDPKKNEALSTARAKAVAAELQKNGIDAKSLVVSGKGEPLGATFGGIDRKSQADRAVVIKIAR